MKHKHLSLSWSVSRGRETYGYNICRLDDHETGKRYRCSGGGYDMVGTVIGQWLADHYQDRLVAIAERMSARYNKADRYQTDQGDLYGGCWRTDVNRVTLDGACGRESMCKIAEAVGLQITSDYDRRKDRTVGFFVTDTQDTQS